MTITNDNVVDIHFRLRNDAGEELDASVEGRPLVYLHGHGNLVVGLEAALDGRQAGDRFTVTVPPELGYGAYDPALDLRVAAEAFADEKEGVPAPGSRFQADPGDGQPRVFTVVRHEEDGNVLITANHPLAGEHLHFEIEVAAVRPATAIELAHGHAHGEGGCGG